MTSDQKASAKMIANIYKRRWAVELLFRWMKGHLDLRRLPLKPERDPYSTCDRSSCSTSFAAEKIISKFKGTLGNFCARCEPRSREKSFRDAGLGRLPLERRCRRGSRVMIS
ncbi:MAG: transposase [Bdellovibrionales bacterium]|nr:transposase [Bdellovibrionales bacterium]